MFSSPFLGTFFQFVAENHEDFEKWKAVFVPFLGDLFSMMVILLLWLGCMSFRPLSWGLSFNVFTVLNDSGDVVFVPFPGDFLSIWEIRLVYGSNSVEFSSPFLGTFFQYTGRTQGNDRRTVFVPFLGDFLSIGVDMRAYENEKKAVFVPFLGDFLSIRNRLASMTDLLDSFRPLSWGLSFNDFRVKRIERNEDEFSSPFLGTFFQ